jgi:hypothetical protein
LLLRMEQPSFGRWVGMELQGYRHQTLWDFSFFHV